MLADKNQLKTMTKFRKGDNNKILFGSKLDVRV